MASNIKQPKTSQTNTGEIDTRTYLLFVETAEAVLKYSDVALNRVGLSLIKLMVLELLQSRGGKMIPSEIAYLTNRGRNSITTQIDRMEKDKLISTVRSKEDARSIWVSITPKGKQAIKDVGPLTRNIVKQVMTSIPDARANVLAELLKTIRENAYAGLERF